MSDIILTQVEADRLIALDKFSADTDTIAIPANGRLSVTLLSSDRREEFSLDIEKEI